MDKETYLKELENKLVNLPADEKNEALKYYDEYFNEANDDAKVISELGDSEKLAENILKEYNIKVETKKEIVKDDSKRTVTLIICVILAVVFFPVIFSIAMSIIGIMLSVLVSGIALVIAAFATLGVGIVTFSANVPIALVILGTSLIILSLGILFTIGGIKLIPIFIKAIVWVFEKLFGKGGNK